MAQQFDTAANRIDAGIDAGNDYQDTLEGIRARLDDQTSGTSLGTMVGMQLEMTEGEAQYGVKVGTPKKDTNMVNQEAQNVKKQGGG